MKAFEYATPRLEEEIVEFLSSEWGQSEIMAGGTDLVGLMQKMLVTPSRVVDVSGVQSMRGIAGDSVSVTIGAVTTLDEIAESPLMKPFASIQQAIAGIDSTPIQCQSTLGGELCQRPQCWYFRNGHGYLAVGGKLIADGNNRYHAIFGNSGPAKFVHASRLAPALIALNAQVRILGPSADEQTILPLELFYRAPRSEGQRETVLLPNQVLTHVILPVSKGIANATYEVKHGDGPESPLMSAAAALKIVDGYVADARIVLGHAAPTPWISHEAAQALHGQPLTEESATRAGEAAVALATPLSENRYKVQLAQVAVKRAILRAAGMETGGF